jgi:hypothetical protein
VQSNFTFSGLINWCSSIDMSTWNLIISTSSQLYRYELQVWNSFLSSKGYSCFFDTSTHS